MTEKQNIVTATSEGHGYNYAALSDIVLQGYKLPKMKTGTEDGKEYVYYLDEELKEWIRGAQVVVPENIFNKEGKAKMNQAQLYGSALTYARRYTSLMALSLACEDDKELEDGEQKKEPEKATPKQVAMLQGAYVGEDLEKLLKINDITKLEDISKDTATKIIGELMKKRNAQR